ncbi:uncharacterized protein [Apostichopus japonicus]|uniref:uncharacterized protein n=1 Tax=Stichopus japonicus TaxID=307972 RepID=UPI003AB2BBA8
MDCNAGKSLNSSKNRCFAHCADVLEDIKPFTTARWTTFLKSVDIWKDLVGNQADIATAFLREHRSTCVLSLPIPEFGGCHNTCYRYFTDSSKQKRGKISKEKQLLAAKSSRTSELEPSTSSIDTGDEATNPQQAPRVLRSSSALAGVTKEPSVPSHILPKICIFCCRYEKSYTDAQRRKRKEQLMLCEQPDGGKVAAAAKDKKDDRILLQIRDRDCVAIELRYHRSCYRSYTGYQTRKYVEPKEQLYATAFDAFCKYYIEHKILREKQIYRMTSLRRYFGKAVKDVEMKDASNYRTYSLKQRLKRRFPQLCFLQPKKRCSSEMVYVETLSAEDLVPEAVGSEADDTDTTTDTDNTDAEEEQEPPRKRPKGIPNSGQSKPQMSSLRDCYSTALDLKEEIMQAMKKTNLPWPPTSDDLTLDAARKIVPTKLYNFIAWIVGVSDEPTDEQKVKIQDAEDRRILAIGQDIIYLATKGRKMMPKHASLSMAIRHLSGSAQLIGLLNGFGHSVSHTNVLEHDTALGQQEIDRGNVLPSSLNKSIYTTLVWDNNDFGECTLSGKGTTHNTNGIAVQHVKLDSTSSGSQLRQHIRKSRKRSLPAPASEMVRFGGLKKSSPQAFDDSVQLEVEHYNVVLHPYREKEDAFYVSKFSEARLLPSWTGFNQLLSSNIPPKATIAYLPVVDASPTDLNTVNTVLHRSLEIADQLELPSIVVVVDQAIYCKAQTIRWQTPIFQERIVIRLGAFHTTMTALACIGKRFQDAGFQDVLIEAGVVATGSVTGVMNGHNYNRSVRCHKLMAEALHRLRWQSFLSTLEEQKRQQFKKVVSSLQASYPREFDTQLEGSAYKAMMARYGDFIKEGKNNATFAFWCSYLEMIGNILLFIRATREGDWKLHLATVRVLLPWMFAYDRTNYSRYLPVYWLEMNKLPITNPFIHDELVKGHFAVQRQDTHGFAGVACDMTIEQTANRDSKTRGGVKGFSNNQGATNRWIRGHHERALITRQCEEMAGKGEKVSRRADLTKSRMTRDQNDINNIMSTIMSMTNPFDSDPEADTAELVHLSSGVIASADVCSDLMNAYTKGDEAFINFSKTRLQGDIYLNKTLSKMKLKTFADVGKATVNMNGKEVALKSDRELLARLIIIGRVRKVDQRNMLTFSLSLYPPALAKLNGCLVKTNKASLLHHLEKSPEASPTVELPKECVWIVDGMAKLQQLNSKTMPDTIGQLAKKILRDLVYLARSTGSNIIHFVTDTYPAMSIKGAERKRRAASGSQRIKITKPDQPVPKQWKKYLANGFNKEQLVNFLFDSWSTYGEEDLKGISVYIAHAEQCHLITASNGTTNIQEVPELHCTHEEADTRMLLHAKYASDMGSKDIVIKSPDTDVFIIGIAMSPKLESSKLYFNTGKEEKNRTISLQAIQLDLGEETTKVMIGLHCFTGCDSTSSFYGKGKTRPLKLILDNERYRQAFQALGEAFTLTDDVISTLEDFVCKLYNMQEHSSVNDARYALFSMATRQEDIMPPNRDALLKHSQRANYQAAIWKRGFESHPDIPSPVGHGWKLVEGNLAIDWMDLQPAQQSIMELTRCTCNKSKCQGTDEGCCAALGLRCTELCGCKNCANMPIPDEEPATEPEGDEEDDDEHDDEQDNDDAEFHDDEENF